MFNSLKFSYSFLYLSYLVGCMATPVAKWRKPMVEGNISLILLPQDNRQANDSDVLVAVKSNCKSLNYDTNLLNLVVGKNPGCSKETIGLGQNNGIKQADTANYFTTDNDPYINGNNTDQERVKMNNTLNLLRLLGLNNNTSVKETENILKLLGMLNISSQKENYASGKNIALTMSVTTEIPQAASSSKHSFFKTAFNALNKFKHSSYTAFKENANAINDNEMSDQEDNKSDPQNRNSKVDESNLADEEEDGCILDLDYSAIKKTDRANIEENVNTIISNPDLSTCLPFFADVNETDMEGFDESKKSQTFDHGMTEIPIQVASSQQIETYNTMEGNNPTFSAYPTESRGEDKSSGAALIGGGKTDTLALSNRGGENINKPAATFSQDVVDFESGRLLSAKSREALLPDHMDLEQQNGQTICTTIIVKCNPVKNNEVFEQISKMVTDPGVATISQEVKHGAGEVVGEHLATKTSEEVKHGAGGVDDGHLATTTSQEIKHGAGGVDDGHLATTTSQEVKHGAGEVVGEHLATMTSLEVKHGAGEVVGEHLATMTSQEVKHGAGDVGGEHLAKTTSQEVKHGAGHVVGEHLATTTSQEVIHGAGDVGGEHLATLTSQEVKHDAGGVDDGHSATTTSQEVKHGAGDVGGEHLAKTTSQEVKHGAGDVVGGNSATTTVLTECFPVNRNDINGHQQSAALAKKITLEPPVDCVSRCKLKGQHTCGPIAEPDAKIKEEEPGLPLVKYESFLGNSEEKAYYKNDPIFFDQPMYEYRLSDLQRKDSEIPMKYVTTFHERNSHIFDMQDNILFPLLLSKIKNTKEKNIKFEEGPSYRSDMNNNNQCDPAANVSIEYPEGPDTSQTHELLNMPIKTSTKMPNEMHTQLNKDISKFHTTFPTQTAQINKNSEMALNIPVKSTTTMSIKRPTQGSTEIIESQASFQMMTSTEKLNRNTEVVFNIPIRITTISILTPTQGNKEIFESHPSSQIPSSTEQSIIKATQLSTTTPVGGASQKHSIADTYHLTSKSTIPVEKDKSILNFLTTPTMRSTQPYSDKGIDVSEGGEGVPITPASNIGGNVTPLTVLHETTKVESTVDNTVLQGSLTIKSVFFEDNKKITPTKVTDSKSTSMEHVVTTELLHTTVTTSRISPPVSHISAESGELKTLKTSPNVNENPLTPPPFQGDGVKPYPTQCRRITTTAVQCGPKPLNVYDDKGEKNQKISSSPGSDSKVHKGSPSKLRQLLVNNLPFAKKPKCQPYKKQDNREDIYIPVDSVKEIVIQIVKNTKQPSTGNKNILEKCKPYKLNDNRNNEMINHRSQLMQEKSFGDSMKVTDARVEPETHIYKQRAMNPLDYFKQVKKR